MKKFNYSSLTAGAFKISGLRLLTTNSLKTIKGLKYSVLSGILYLAPHRTARARSAGKILNLCPSATAGCMAACLYRSGAALIYPKIVQAARIRKSRALANDAPAFMRDLVYDVAKLERTAIKRSLVPAVRLNGTSDLRWEKVACERDDEQHENIMSAFPNVQFYDYTKRVDRGALPENYALTFSRSESNDHECKRMLARGINVAAVFYTARPKDPLPVKWFDHPVIDGDLYDARFQDPAPSVIGLRPKAKARSDSSGFVIRDWSA